jgi:outer membrane protein assembly factor BamD (BamD/ComL family)
MKTKILLAFLILTLLSCQVVGAQTSGEFYSQAVSLVKAKDLDSAFLHFRSLFNEYPNSKYAQRALFATGEYYYLVSNYKEAVTTFIKYLNDYPDSANRLFALMYLYKIAELKQEESLLENLKKEIVDFKQLVFLFRKFKEYKYRSPLLRKHKVIYYIDKVEFYVNGELFEEIPY